jgi:hypothetical protein
VVRLEAKQVSKQVKTINQRYTKQQRKEIAKQLRDPEIEASEWYGSLPEPARYYVTRVLSDVKSGTFTEWLDVRGFSICEYPNSGGIGYIHDALNRLADELDPKEQSK